MSSPPSPSESPGRPTRWCVTLAASCAPSVTRRRAGPGRRSPSLERTAALTRRVAAQTRQRLAGELPPGATRVVSLHDADARPIAKGRLGKPVEFGYKAQLVDNEDGVIVDHNIEAGNPPDAPMLAPAIKRIKRAPGALHERSPPIAATANKASKTTCAPPACATSCSPPRADRPRRAARSRTDVPSARWCDGAPAVKDGSAAPNATSDSPRTRIDGLAGARTWCGHGIFAHNLVKISGLID